MDGSCNEVCQLSSASTQAKVEAESRQYLIGMECFGMFHSAHLWTILRPPKSLKYFQS